LFFFVRVIGGDFEFFDEAIELAAFDAEDTGGGYAGGGKLIKSKIKY
jgi:hypothetical protein